MKRDRRRVAGKSGFSESRTSAFDFFFTCALSEFSVLLTFCFFVGRADFRRSYERRP